MTTFRARAVVHAAMASGVAALLVTAAAASAARAVDSPSPAPAPAKVTFGIGPASAEDVDQRPDFTLLQGRGGTVTDHLALVNLSSVPLDVAVYPVDAVTGADGQVSLEPREKAPKDLASWVTITTPGGKPTVLVPARSKVIVAFTVTVPQNAPVGDHLAGIVASITSSSANAGSPNVALEQRVGVRLNMRVAGAVSPQLAVENLRAHYVGSFNPLGRGTVVVNYTVRNSGNVKLGGQQLVEVSGLIGSVHATDLRDIPLLMPGASVDVTTVVPEVVPALSLSTEVVVTAVAPGTDANPDVPPATASTRLWAVPWSLIGLLLVLALVVLSVLKARGRPSAGRHARGARANLQPLGPPPSGPPLAQATGSTTKEEL